MRLNLRDASFLLCTFDFICEAELVSLIRTHVPEAVVEDDGGDELLLLLPMSEGKKLTMPCATPMEFTVYR